MRLSASGLGRPIKGGRSDEGAQEWTDLPQSQVAKNVIRNSRDTACEAAGSAGNSRIRR